LEPAPAERRSWASGKEIQICLSSRPPGYRIRVGAELRDAWGIALGAPAEIQVKVPLVKTGVVSIWDREPSVLPFPVRALPLLGINAVAAKVRAQRVALAD
jgi:hypothetical protein